MYENPGFFAYDKSFEVYLGTLIREVPDFPQPGINFKDIMPVLGDPKAMNYVVGRMGEYAARRMPNVVIGIESRGYHFSGRLAALLGLPEAPARKPKKLPGDVAGIDYTLEYATGRIEMQKKAIGPGDKILVVDDVCATGGTADALATLVRGFDANVVGMCFLADLRFLGGTKILEQHGYDVFSILHYDH